LPYLILVLYCLLPIAIPTYQVVCHLAGGKFLKKVANPGIAMFFGKISTCFEPYRADSGGKFLKIAANPGMDVFFGEFSTWLRCVWC